MVSSIGGVYAVRLTLKTPTWGGVGLDKRARDKGPTEVLDVKKFKGKQATANRARRTLNQRRDIPRIGKRQGKR